MRGINQVLILGTLGRDPEVRHLNTGVKVAKLSVATNRPFQKDGEWREHTEWHRIELWERQAETAERFLRKGSKLAVEGSLRTDTWQDGEVRRSKTVIRGHRLHLVGGRSEEPGRLEGQAERGDPMDFDQGEIPF